MRKSRVLSVSMYVALGVALTLCAEAQQAAQGLPKVARITVNSPVTLADNGDSWTLDNGILKATLTKRNGNLTALVYHGSQHPGTRQILGADARRNYYRKR
jgi:hypothetical protein